MLTLDSNTYGKTGVRLTQVLRQGDHHEVKELSVTVLFEGEFDESYANADNSKVLPTDTIKNTVYVVARQHPIESIERFARDLSTHFLARVSHIRKVNVDITETLWSRLQGSDAAFVRNGLESRVANLVASRTEEMVTAGIKNVEILKTSQSAFSGYLRDELTTLPETRDRLLGTAMNAQWTYRGGDVDFNRSYEAIRTILLETFAHHQSESVQHTLYAMGKAALDQIATIKDIHITMPNKHRLLIDLTRFGLDNPNQIFVPTDEPSGYIEARLSRRPEMLP